MAGASLGEIVLTLTTYNQVAVPDFMYGTAWKKEATARLVELAVDQGFTAIDTANQLIHYDEALVGEALQSLYKRGVKREKLFLQTKFTSVNGQDHRTPYDARADLSTQVRQSMDSSLLHLHTDWLDSYILHGPYTREGMTEADWEVWAAMEDLYRAGKAKTIGVSNVNARQLQLLCERSVVPMMVQNRCYATTGWDQEVREICRRNKIIYQGFSLLTANSRVLSSATLLALAAELGASPAQLIFRFAMQIGMLPLTGTCSAQHMSEDLACRQWQLSDEYLQMLESLAQFQN